MLRKHVFIYLILTIFRIVVFRYNINSCMRDELSISTSTLSLTPCDSFDIIIFSSCFSCSCFVSGVGFFLIFFFPSSQHCLILLYRRWCDGSGTSEKSFGKNMKSWDKSYLLFVFNINKLWFFFFVNIIYCESLDTILTLFSLFRTLGIYFRVILKGILLCCG